MYTNESCCVFSCLHQLHITLFLLESDQPIHQQNESTALHLPCILVIFSYQNGFKIYSFSNDGI